MDRFDAPWAPAIAVARALGALAPDRQGPKILAVTLQGADGSDLLIELSLAGVAAAVAALEAADPRITPAPTTGA